MLRASAIVAYHLSRSAVVAEHIGAVDTTTGSTVAIERICHSLDPDISLPLDDLPSCLGWFMFRPSGSVLLVTTVSLAAGLLTAPGAAYAADTTTHLSATQMATALKTAAGTSTSAAQDGWKATMTLTLGPTSGSGVYIADPLHGIAFDQLRVADDVETNYAVAGKGLYENLPNVTSRAAVKMMGRPAVRYLFTPRTSLNLAAYLKENAPTPAEVLTDDTAHAGTKTLHDDGSTHYTLDNMDDMTMTMHVSPAGILSSAYAAADDLTMTLTYTYGEQNLTVPAAEATISSAALAQGVAYLDMPARVKKVTYQAAAHARRAAHGRTVKVASLRKVVRRDVAKANTTAHVKMIKVKDVPRGVRVSATNPWTHKTVSYTVKASGKKVVVTS